MRPRSETFIPHAALQSRTLTRRVFLRQLGYCAPALLPAPLSGPVGAGFFPSLRPAQLPESAGNYENVDFRLRPDYPSRSPLEEMLRLAEPGNDAYLSEKYAAELQLRFAALRTVLQQAPVDGLLLSKFVDAVIIANGLTPPRMDKLASRYGIELHKAVYGNADQAHKDAFSSQLKTYVESMGTIEVAEFEIIALRQAASDPLQVDADIRYTLVGARPDRSRVQRLGIWRTSWRRDPSGWCATKWIFTEENIAETARPLFVDVSATSFASVESYQKQLLHSVDYWRSLLDGACGIDVYGNNGIAAGDFDGDGRDDIYVCQPSGLPNRLYRNRGDGTFEDATERAGVGVLDATACALFADFENKGRQDLLVVTGSGPLLFLNQGNGKFAFKENAFAFATPPQGTFTHAAIADYDRDGRLDIYFCLYSYYLGLDQYHYPAPYFDARNGPPNFLFHNDGAGKFIDRTAASGLGAENDRFSFACAWGDISGDGRPDLYVANDFGRNNLYRNNGDGTFLAVSEQANVNVPGAGMSACWFDSDNNGKQDIYVSNMWSAAGQRVSSCELFHPDDAPATRSFYAGHARGNSFYRNRGAGKFENAAESCGVAMGRWAWSADAWDFDHDGYSDLYIANGYISGSSQTEVSSFFWRQVVGNSPASSAPSPRYEHGWNAINELIRSDHTWAGYERNTLYRNNGDGAFSDVSGLSGLDLSDDSRAFALADLDGDGRLEVIVKNRTAPQVRVLRNVMSAIGDALCFRLQGTNGNRDAIGAAITVRNGGLRQTKYLQAGTGFLSQHSKELFFGLGKVTGQVSASVRWPNGSVQDFSEIPANHRVTIQEGKAGFSAAPFTDAQPHTAEASALSTYGASEAPGSSWLLDPLPAPDFSLPDLANKTVTLASFRGKPLLLCFWSAAAPRSVAQLRAIHRHRSAFAAKNLQALAVHADTHSETAQVRSVIEKDNLTLPVLLATREVSGIYNILYRFLFDRRRDLPLPCSFLVDASGFIVKVFQGTTDPGQILSDASAIPRGYQARVAQALPFPGKLYGGEFKRNDFTYGVALFQHGYLDSAAESFKQVLAAQPKNAEAYYNLGTLYLRKNDFTLAKTFLEKAVTLRAAYPEAWNNLGMIAAQTNQTDDAIHDFQASLAQRPDYVTALLNLGNVYRRQGMLADSRRLLGRAVEVEPESAEANYSLGMLYARDNDLPRATDLLKKSLALRPNYPDAINNLGVLYVQQGKTDEAEKLFTDCIRVAPDFDQAYLNLARLYMLRQQKDKARATLESLLKLRPEHKLAQQALGMLD